MVKNLELPDYILSDIQTLLSISEIENISVLVDDEFINITFSLHFDEYAQSEDHRFVSPEPIILRYPIVKHGGSPEIISGRPNFPRDIAHLNPVEDESIASICLWRKGGTSELYRHRGIHEIINILQDWLVDASLMKLESDGWEPSPIFSAVNLLTSTRKLQELAFPIREPTIFKAEISTFLFKDIFVIGFSSTEDGWAKKEVSKVNNPLQSFLWNNASKVSGYLLCDPEQDISRHNKTVKNLNDLENYTSNRALQALIKSLKGCRSDKRKTKACIVIIAHKRPIAFVDEVPDLSVNPEARKIEPVGFFIYRNPNSNEFSIENINIKAQASSSLLQSISGGNSPIDTHIGIIGCGA